MNVSYISQYVSMASYQIQNVRIVALYFWHWQTFNTLVGSFINYTSKSSPRDAKMHREWAP